MPTRILPIPVTVQRLEYALQREMPVAGLQQVVDFFPVDPVFHVQVGPALLPHSLGHGVALVGAEQDLLLDACPELHFEPATLTAFQGCQAGNQES